MVDTVPVATCFTFLEKLENSKTSDYSVYCHTFCKQISNISKAILIRCLSEVSNKISRIFLQNLINSVCNVFLPPYIISEFPDILKGFLEKQEIQVGYPRIKQQENIFSVFMAKTHKEGDVLLPSASRTLAQGVELKNY